MKISVIIVSYNAKDYLQFCLESCTKALLNCDAEIIVVDNNSTDKSLKSLTEIFSNVNFYFLEENIGFSRANNFGVDKATGDYILILNPDTIIPEDIFDELITFYNSKPNIGLLGTRLIDINGKFHEESKRNLPKPLNSILKLLKLNSKSKNGYYNESLEADQVGQTAILVGAFMFTTKQKYLEIGGFDSRYFMYGEDIDLSYSYELAGYKNHYNGKLIVVHFKGKSTNVNSRYFSIFYNAMNQFVSKYYKNQPSKLLLLKLGITFSYIVARFKFIFYKTSNSNIDTKKSELYWLKKSEELNDLEAKHIVLSTNNFTYKEILKIISQNNSPQLSFYIHSHLSDKTIGYKGLIE